MNKRMRKTIYEYRAVIVDMDGTLYYQFPLRLHMAVRLACFYLRHPGRLKELWILYKFRRNRERELPADGGSVVAPSTRPSLREQQYRVTAGQTGVEEERVRAVVERWIHKEPLTSLIRFRDEELAGLLAELRDRQIPIAVYSDYPVQDKLEALKLRADLICSSEDPEIGCMKPDPKGLVHILERLKLDRDEAVMIGDRREKDGEAALAAGMDYCILGSSRRRRFRQLQELRGRP